MTKRFLEEPFERNPVLQFAGVNYLMTEECHKPLRVLSVWSKKLEALGWWYDQLMASSLSKQGRGPTPLTMVGTRDLHVRGQQHQDGPRDRLINNLVVKTARAVPILVQMADHNRGRAEPVQSQGTAGHSARDAGRRQSSVSRGGPAHSRPRAAGAVRTRDGTAVANAHAGHGGRGPLDGRQSLWTAGPRRLPAPAQGIAQGIAKNRSTTSFSSPDCGRRIPPAPA